MGPTGNQQFPQQVPLCDQSNHGTSVRQRVGVHSQRAQWTGPLGWLGSMLDSRVLGKGVGFSAGRAAYLAGKE